MSSEVTDLSGELPETANTEQLEANEWINVLLSGCVMLLLWHGTGVFDVVLVTNSCVKPQALISVD